MADYDSARSQMTLAEIQYFIRRMYGAKDSARGVEGTFMWLTEEVGELAAVLRQGTDEQRRREFADVLAWLVTMANVCNIDLTASLLEKYGQGCPGCAQMICTCDAKP